LLDTRLLLILSLGALRIDILQGDSLGTGIDAAATKRIPGAGITDILKG